MSEKKFDTLVSDLFRHESGKMTAVLTKIFGLKHIDFAEDIVQETFATAIHNWSLNGLPDNPPAWLYRVAKNKALDQIRKNRYSEELDVSEENKRLLHSEYTVEYMMNKLWVEDEIKDDLLRMMFACCHQSIKLESQVTLVLKTLCGFSTAEIASALVVNEQTVSKRLYRVKEFFRTNDIKPSFPPANEIRERVNAVLTSIYLLFNEGYSSTHNGLHIRKDLLNQAMYLCKLLTENKLTNLPETSATLALMCFHTARIDSRMDDEGNMILLADQDRSCWNVELINQGYVYLNASATGQLSTYHFEAAIAYEHCIARSFEETNWKQILAYYDLMLQVNANHVVALNRLIIYRQVHGLEDTLKAIKNSPFRDDWDANYLFNSFMGDLFKETEPNKALNYYEKAINQGANETEIKLLKDKIEKVQLAMR